MAVLRAVQTGTTAIAAGTGTGVTTVTLPTALLDTSKAFVIASSEPGSASPRFDALSYQIISATQIELRRYDTYAEATALNVRWYVVEFISGVTVQRGSITDSATTSTATITAVNLSKACIIASRQTEGINANFDDFIELDFQDSTTLRARRLDITAPNRLQWQVVEFADSNVQSGSITGWTTASTTATIAAVNTAKTIIFFSYQSSGSAASVNNRLTSATLTNSTTITFERSASANSTISITWFAVEFTDATTVQRGNESFSTSDLTRNVTISAVDTARSLPLLGGWDQNCGISPYSAADNPGAARFNSTLTSSTQLTLTRGFTGSATAIAPWRVITFPASAGADLAGTIAATSGLSGALSVDRSLSATVAAVSGATGALSVDRALSAGVVSSSGLTGGLAVERSLVGLIAAQSGISGALSVDRAIAGSVSGVSALSGALTSAKPLHGSATAQSGLTGSLSVDRALSATVAVIFGLSGALSAGDGISGAIAASAVLSGALSVDRSLSAAVAAVSGLLGALTADKPLSSSIAVSSGLAGLLSVDGALFGTISASSGLVGDLIVGSGLSGAIALTSGLSGALNSGASIELSGAIAAQSGLSGALARPAVGLRIVAFI